MATGEDLGEEANPRLHGRKPKNDDILEKGVWIKHPETGVVHLVNHKFHVNRLLMDGGRVVEQPEHEQAVQATAQADSVEALKAEIARLSALLTKEPNGSTSNDGTIDSPREIADRRPGRDKSAVR